LRALLLAAGLGTRLRPVTDHLPKCLVGIHNIPLLDYWLDLLLEGDAIERVLVNTCYRAEQVRAHVDASRWRDRVDLVHEDELLGTGGTVLANRLYFGERPFIAAHADNLTRFDLRRFIAVHQGRPACCDMTMMVFETDTPHSCGIVEIDTNGIVQALHEKVAKPAGCTANAAVYIFEPSVSAVLAAIGKPVIDLSTEVLPGYLGKIVAFRNTSYHRDIGTLQSLAMAEAEF
jgi:mannose-1-phosphate guanylyltransferase